MYGRSVFINERDGKEDQRDDEYPTYIKDDIPPPMALDADPFQYGSLREQEDQAAQYQAEDQDGQPDRDPTVVQAPPSLETELVLVEGTGFVRVRGRYA